jgi:hypothetical protein
MTRNKTGYKDSGPERRRLWTTDLFAFLDPASKHFRGEVVGDELLATGCRGPGRASGAGADVGAKERIGGLLAPGGGRGGRAGGGSGVAVGHGGGGAGGVGVGAGEKLRLLEPAGAVPGGVLGGVWGR